MKSTKLISAVLGTVTLALSIISCNKSSAGDGDMGILHFKFSDDSIPFLRSKAEILDTNSFYLSVKDSGGNPVYDGTYGNAPEFLTLKAGTYTIKAISCEFYKPDFSVPQFGDEQGVVIAPGSEESIILHCRQLNAGVRLLIDRSFLAAYPSGALLLRSGDGSLMYSYKEKRIAYFWPGEVQLILTENGVDQKLMTRILKANDILTLSVKASVVTERHRTFCMEVDTTRNRTYEDFLIVGNGDGQGNGGDYIPGGGGEDDADGDPSHETVIDALTVADAIRNPDQQDVWIKGFIAGGDLTSTKASYRPPFQSKTNILVSPRAGQCPRESCIAVSLPSGKVRDALNLVDNPNLLGSSVYIQGDLTYKYFGLVGLKNTISYRF